MGADQTGEWIWTHRAVPHQDPFSFTAGDTPSVEHEWGACLLLWLVYTTAGVLGLTLMKFLVASATYGLILHTARRLGASLSLLLLAFAPVVYASAERFMERPHIFSSLLLVTYLSVLLRFRHGQLKARWLWVIPPLHVLWTNLHGGWIQGTALVGCFALGETVMWMRARYVGIGVAQALRRHDIERFVVLVPLCVPSSLVTPYGTNLLTFPVQPITHTVFMERIWEWMPPHRWAYFRAPAFAYLLHVGALLITTGAGRRDGAPGPSSWGRDAHHILHIALWLTWVGLVVASLHPPSAAAFGPGPVSGLQTVMAAGFYGLLGCWGLWALVNGRRVDVTHVAVVSVFVWLSIRYSRALADAALVTFPVLTMAVSAALVARHAGPYRPRRRPPGSIDRPAAIFAGAVVLLVLAGHAWVFGYPYVLSPRTTRVQEQGFGIGTNQPLCAIDFLMRQHLSGHAFVPPGLASMLLFRMYPQLRTSVDTRDYVAGDTLFAEHWAAMEDPEAMRTYLAHHAIDVVLLKHLSVSRAVMAALESSGWPLVHVDDGAMALVPRRPDMDDLIQREAYRWIRAGDNVPVTAGNARRVLDEVNRALHHCPEHASFAYAYKAQALYRLGRPQEALEARLKIPAKLMLE